MDHLNALVRAVARLMTTEKAPMKGRYAGKILGVILTVILAFLSTIERVHTSEEDNRIQNPHNQSKIKIEAKIDVHIR